MSRLLTISLIALYAITLTQAYMPHVNYWMNRDYIAAELCENKDKPELDCNGKCHLKKEIQHNNDDRNEEQEVSSTLMLEFFQHPDAFNLILHELTVEAIFHHYSDPVVSGFVGIIFRPPKV